MTARDVVAVIRLGRPHFLVGGFVLYALGAAVAAAHGHAIDPARYAAGQAAITCLQLMTHYANDYFDLAADRANTTPTRWSGGSRVLPSGALPPVVARVAARVLAVLGAGAIAWVAATGAGPLAVPTLAAIAVLAWAYSAPPLRLCARGLGELDTAIVVTALVPWLGFYLQAPDLAGAGALALTIAPLAALQVAMLLAIEMPDAAGDAATGKRTLVVRLGAPAAARLYATIVVAAALAPVPATALGLPRAVAAAMLVPAPVAAWRARRIHDHADRGRHEAIAFWAVFQLVATSALALAGWLVP